MAAEQVVRGKRLQELRAGAVMLGPSLVLDGLLAASILAASAAAWEQGRRRGQPIWKLAAVGALLPWAYRLLLPRMMRLGATREELRQSLPGDELVAQRDAAENTHALTLRARPEDVWPWLVQMGSGERGGFYSYDWLDRLAGAPIHSAERILPEYQHPKVGEPVTPGGPWRVLRIEPERVFIFGNSDFSWAFVLQPLDGEKTRLLIRIRVNPLRAGPFGSNALNLPHLIMQRKMMKGLRRRSEQTAREREAGTRKARRAPTPARAQPGSEQSPTPGV